MGHTLYYYFVKASSIGGGLARTRLSTLTEVSSIEASFLPDTQEYISRFETAFSKIKNEFRNTDLYQSLDHVNTSVNEAEQLRFYISIYTDILSQRHLFLGDKSQALQRFTEALVKGLKVDRASIWLYDEGKTKIICQDLFIKKTAKHESGVEIPSHLFPCYFKALKEEKTVSASDACYDERTKEFTESYFKPLNIVSLLDVPIWINGELAGVVCSESCSFRRWIADEEDFVYMMSNALAFILETAAFKPKLA